MKNALCFTVFLFMAISGFAQPPDSLWSRTFGGDSNDVCTSVLQTTDGDFVLAGYTKSYGVGNNDYWLMKITANGGNVWSRTFGGSGADECYALLQTLDGGYALAGFTESFGAGNRDIWLVKTNASGDSLWSRTYGGSENDWCYSALQLDDGNLLLAGYTASYGSGGGDVWLLKTNTGGDSLWSRTFGGSNYDEANFLLRTSDAGYTIGATTQSFGLGSMDCWLVKTNESGDSLWSHAYGGNANDGVRGMVQTPDGNYIISGYTTSFGAVGYDAWLIKADSNGDTLWCRKLGGTGTDVFYNALQTEDGGYLVGGYTGSFGAQATDYWLVKFSVDGDTLWTRTFGGSSWEIFRGMLQASDGGYLLYGYTESFGAGGRDVWLLKTGPLSAVETARNSLPSDYVLYPAFPNPFNATTVLKFDVPAASRVTIRACDVLGRDAGEIADAFYSAGTHDVRWDCGNRASGLYFITMSGPGYHCIQKAILLR